MNMVQKKKINDSEIREAGSFYNPINKITKHYIDVVKHDVKGLGRWMYCKYCYKSVKPSLSGINQAVCSECGAGLSPDFFRFDNLLKWLKTGDSNLIKIDHESKEAKDWLEQQKK